ncbi:MAG: DUF1385 domain-containing protein [Lachnospiraceae bacterium]|nr:DUF1385 domain-containing protein [Lachnospiraceae bacterium]
MGKKKKTCYSGIGGQAVMEGIMMRNKNRYAVAVRKPDKNIEIHVAGYEQSESWTRKVPFVRGIFNFIDSLKLGMETLTFSASFYEEDEEETGFDRFMGKIFGAKAEKAMMGITMIVSLIIALAIFMVLPYFVASLLEKYLSNPSLIAIIEGVLRVVIFVVYVLLISLMKDIRRVFMYHGAEHKCINCIESGKPLNVQNIKKSSRLHRRCGTSFLLIVMVISIICFFFIRVDNMVLRLVLRIVLIPVIAGISYEVLRLAGKFDNWVVKVISAPGMLLQRLTTKEPDEDMIEVAIKAVEAVFDWKEYLKENFEYEAVEEDEWLDDEDEAESVSNGAQEDLVSSENATSSSEDEAKD